ncbi:trehalose-phosphatase [Candidatus Saganbacteria bacterium CG08_land_8_20_14_0_20_45_16]|uniref:Trehalose 6-phosphate phosphatase n=1 Tax=Candidatus Saganbacteria bacterium CG08_land_8_20_14_0_20_45_16 TaxID=2014293 RepID=A0A2H0XVQ4_UNCSA|nr:MAG: trehalose-phosphatase [Candidatus Saganbacteria bacterium CG08_land_8_20_14_0_20_45_16]
MRCLLFFDFDGTLTPIVARPSLAKLGKDKLELLKNLAKIPAVTIAIISGRKLTTLKEKINIPGSYYVGNHGFEISGPKTNFVHPKAKEAKPLFKKILLELKKGLRGIKGIIIEDKGATLSLHYRCVEGPKVAEVKRIFNKLAESWPKSKIKITEGKKVFEIRPKVKWDKGEAVRWLLKHLGFQKGDCPIYIGDDTTDEDAFKVLASKGVTIKVGPLKNSLAQKSLKDIEAVYKFLETLLLEISAKSC